MNNKGFMMAEVVVVSSIIIVTLTGLYVSYNKILSIYNQRVDYYDVTTLYKLANYRDNNITPETAPSLEPKIPVDGETIYYVNKDDITNNTLKDYVSNQTFKDYLEYLDTSLDVDNLYIGDEIPENKVENLLVMERCITTDNCKYAYLEGLS